jgi:hypothetical protein
MLTLALDVVDQLLGGVGRLLSAFVPFDWLLIWSSCFREFEELRSQALVGRNYARDGTRTRVLRSGR